MMKTAFKRKSLVDCVEEILEQCIEPMTAPQILSVLKKLGRVPGGKRPLNTLYGIMNSYRRNNKRFSRMEDGKWTQLPKELK